MVESGGGKGESGGFGGCFYWSLSGGGGVKAGFVGGCAEGNRKLGMVSCTVHSLLPDMAST
jgi:hypothetical protein